MKQSASGTKELRQSRKEKDKSDLEKIKSSIITTLNPFDDATNKNVLFNLKTGRQISESGEMYLLNVIKDGAEKRDQFIQECQSRPERFEEPIKKTPVHNFVSENMLKKNKSKKLREIANIKGTRDMFGRLLYLAVKKQVNLDVVFLYPLLPEPSCFVHPDGALRESNKDTVFHLMESKVKESSPPVVDTIIADGMFMLRSCSKDKSPTYAAFARTLLIRILKLTTHRADLCFDVYKIPTTSNVTKEEMKKVKDISLLDHVKGCQVTFKSC